MAKYIVLQLFVALLEITTISSVCNIKHQIFGILCIFLITGSSIYDFCKKLIHTKRYLVIKLRIYFEFSARLGQCSLIPIIFLVALLFKTEEEFFIF